MNHRTLCHLTHLFRAAQALLPESRFFEEKHKLGLLLLSSCSSFFSAATDCVKTAGNNENLLLLLSLLFSLCVKLARPPRPNLFYLPTLPPSFSLSLFNLCGAPPLSLTPDTPSLCFCVIPPFCLSQFTSESFTGM